MTAYSAIPSGDVDPDSPVTTGLITKLRDNPLAQFEGDVSAPAFGADVIDTAQLVAAAVGRSEIANSTTTSTGTTSGTNKVNINLNDWALFPMIHSEGDGGKGHISSSSSDGGSASSPRFSFADDNATNAYDVDHRWIIAA